MRCRSVLALLAVSAVGAASPALASAATISGTVTEAGSNAALGNVEVCWHKNPYDVEDGCTSTAADGTYALSAEPGEYSIHFRDRLNRNVVNQYYGGSVTYPGARVTLTDPSETLSGIDAQLQPGSTIDGAVTDADSGDPIAGIPVCAFAEFPGGDGYQRCSSSGATGAYVINGLTAGNYEVEFQSGLLNYQPQDYNGKVWPEQADRVAIAGPGETVPSINAAMKVGVEITGRLTAAGTSQPLMGIPVELLQPGKESTGFIVTDANGQYAYRGLREGEYILAFSTPHGPFGTDIDCFATQYYKGSATLGGATVLRGVPGSRITGIDAELVRSCPNAGPPPLQVTFTPATNPSKPKPIHCGKGSHRKRVKGKVRCVKRYKHRHHRRKVGR